VFGVVNGWIMNVGSIHSARLPGADPSLGEDDLSRSARAPRIYGNILVPVDDSSACEESVWDAVELATALGSRIKLVHVITRTPWMAMGTGPAAIEDLIIQLQSAGESMLHRIQKDMRTSGVEIDAKVIEGFGRRVGELVVAEASSWPADLITLGVRRRTGIRHILTGGNVDYILRHSRIPVLLIPSEGS
jgi:nucleotide-binding universal stress UspA family protein